MTKQNFKFESLKWKHMLISNAWTAFTDYSCAVCRYKRFKKGHHNKDAGTNIESSNGTSKYVILDDDTEDQDDTGWLNVVGRISKIWVDVYVR